MILETGSKKGIGRAIAETLANERAEIIINGRSKEPVDEALCDINKTVDNANILGVACDFAKRKEITELINSGGKVDIPVNNVGIFEPMDFLKIPDED